MTSATSAQLRKIKKPMIERRRRERINDCLNQLKKLVLQATQKDESRYSKMEKADILEMTVSHLQTIYRCPPSPSSSDPAMSDSSTGGGERYAVGYRQCAVEVARFLTGPSSAVRDVTRLKLMRHLTAVLQTKLHRHTDDDDDDDDDKLFPAMTSFSSEPEIVAGSRDSVCSETDVDEMSSVPTTADDQTVSESSVSAAQLCRHKAVVDGQQSAVASVNVNSVNGSLNDFDSDLSLQARSDDCRVWRPW